ncbi:unnamed protein product, partial [Nesidiocoris tenuis]
MPFLDLCPLCFKVSMYNYSPPIRAAISIWMDTPPWRIDHQLRQQIAIRNVRPP